MLEEEKYNQAIHSLQKILTDASDMINAEIIPYNNYFTSTGKWDSRKPGFMITFIISNVYLSPRKVTSIMADGFNRIDNWMEEWSDKLAFLEYKLSTVGGENSRMELKIIFDDIVDSAKRLLLR